MIADQVLRPAGKIGELRRGNVDAKLLIKRGKHFTEMNRSRAYFLAPT